MVRHSVNILANGARREGDLVGRDGHRDARIRTGGVLDEVDARG
jgi:hypothetical protein